MNPMHTVPRPQKIKKYAAILSAVWTLVIGLSLTWNYIQEQRGVRQSAKISARAQIEQDIIYRRWNAGHGGVYVLASPTTPPNPYLTQVKNTITTSSGRDLTLVNPAYMTRQVHELGRKTDDIYGHITSLKPIRPQNKADEWEKNALQSFEKGAKESAAVQTRDGDPYMRLMLPLITEQSCLQCHAEQGYKVGDIRGGISADVPMKPYYQLARQKLGLIALGHGLLWLIGIGFISYGAGHVNEQEKKRYQAGRELLQAKEETEALNRELQQKNDEAYVMAARAEAGNKSKTEFLANMSHEIRTPLHGILGMLHILRDTSLSGEQNKYVEMAIKSSRRLHRLLNDILDLSKIEANKIEIHEEEFSLSELIQSIEDILSQSCLENKNSLRFTTDPRIQDVLSGDHIRLTQILFNLVGNAAKYTRNGEVDVHAQLLTGTSPGRCRILFTIADTGHGIPEDKIEQVFESFTQVNESGSPYTRKFEGAGLGLPLVKRLVDLMGGNMAFVSQTGEGTTVYVSLPFTVSQDQPHENAHEGQEASCGSGGSKVLLADDDQTTQLYIRRLLEKYGFEVVVAGNGEQVLAELANTTCSCVLMDVQMPVLDGVETTRRIRASQTQFRDIPIIAMTAYAMRGDREKFLNAGMDDYIAKPVDRFNILQLLEKYIGS